MKFINIDGEVKEVSTNATAAGTCYQGEVEVSYDTLVRIFGDPQDGGVKKVDAEWIVMTPKGVAVIYNGKSELPTVMRWHIGGKTIEVLPFIYKALNQTLVQAVNKATQ